MQSKHVTWQDLLVLFSKLAPVQAVSFVVSQVYLENETASMHANLKHACMN